MKNIIRIFDRLHMSDIQVKSISDILSPRTVHDLFLLKPKPERYEYLPLKWMQA